MSIDATDPNLRSDPHETAPTAPAPVIASLLSPPSPSARGRDGPSGITVEARRRIGRNLRLLYAEVLDQPLPDRFGALLADLAAGDDTGGSS